MATENIESILQEDRLFEPADTFVKDARVNKEQLDELRQQAQQDYESFWAELARGTFAGFMMVR